jgi:hypothetical protein
LHSKYLILLANAADLALAIGAPPVELSRDVLKEFEPIETVAKMMHFKFTCSQQDREQRSSIGRCHLFAGNSKEGSPSSIEN